MLAWTPFVAGLAAGLGIALPLGAIGVLILREGVERGIRMAAVAAFAVATVDFAYALVAVVVGERVAQALAEIERILPVGFAEGARYGDPQLLAIERYC